MKKGDEVMKKMKYLFCALLSLIFMPMFVFAAEKEPINVYIFKSSTCPHCQDAMSFFSELKEDSQYGSYFNLVPFETNGTSAEIKENVSLAEKVAKHFGTVFEGVPLIVIGEERYEGFASSMSSQIKKEIETCYQSQCEDIVAGIQNGTLKGSSFDAVMIFVILGVFFVGGGYFIYLARQKTEEEPALKKEEEFETKVLEPVKDEPKKVAKKTTTTTKKTTQAKKKTTSTKGKKASEQKKNK